MSPARLQALQTTRLAQLLRVAMDSSVLYRKRLQGLDPAHSRLEDLPVSTKPDLMQHFDEWIADPCLRLADLRAFTADALKIGQAFAGRYTVWESSGTRGEPGVFVQDEQAMAVYDTLEAFRRDSPRPWQRLIDPLMLTERIAVVGATGGHFASQVTVHRLRRLNPWLGHSLRSFSILQPSADLVAQLDAFAPTIVATYPTAAALLADEAHSGRFHTRIAELWTGGETLTPAVRSHVVEQLGCALRNSYGASEFLAMGWECGRGALHANADWVLLEAVDKKHRPVPPGTWSNTTLVTNLANHVQPLIRCDIGDRIRWSATPCACGSALPVFEVLGRQDVPLRMAGRGGRAVTLLPLALTTVLEDEAGVFEFQLGRRDAHTLVLRLLASGSAGDEAGARGRAALLAFGSRQGVAGLRVEVEPCKALQHGRSGKLQRVLEHWPAAA